MMPTTKCQLSTPMKKSKVLPIMVDNDNDWTKACYTPQKQADLFVSFNSPSYYETHPHMTTSSAAITTPLTNSTTIIRNHSYDSSSSSSSTSESTSNSCNKMSHSWSCPLPPKTMKEQKEKDLLRSAAKGQLEIVKTLIGRGRTASLYNLGPGTTWLSNSNFNTDVALCHSKSDGNVSFLVDSEGLQQSECHSKEEDDHHNDFTQQRQHQPDINCKTPHGLTPLHYAVLKNHYLVAEVLLEAGAGPLIMSNSGQTPLDIAQQSNLKLFELLSNYVGMKNNLHEF
eukprot:Awhi_evm1s3750